MIEQTRLLEHALYDWAAQVIADAGRTEQVIWTPNNGPRIPPPYIALAFVTERTPGQPWYSQVKIASPEDSGEQDIRIDKRLTFTAYGVGRDSFDLLEELYDSIGKQKYRLLLAARGLVIPKAEAIVGIPTQIGTETEDQRSFDFYVTFIRIAADDPGWIEHAIITPEAPLSENIQA